MRERDTPPTRPAGLDLFRRMEAEILDSLPGLEDEAVEAAEDALATIRRIGRERYPDEEWGE